MKNKTFQDTSLIALRLIIAAIFLSATYAKWGYLSIGATGASASMINLTWFVMIVEPLGAIALISGFLTKWAAAGLGIIMVGAVFVLRFTMNTALFTQTQGVGLDYNLLILGGCLVLMSFGAGRWSIDAMRHKESKN